MKSKDHLDVPQSLDVTRSMKNLEEADCAPDCGIARDLMPLRLENLCGEASAGFVDRHVASCQPCAQIYDELRAATLKPVSAEQADLRFSEAFKQMVRTLRLRNVLLLLMGIFLGFVLLFVGNLAYTKLCVNPEKPIPLSAVTVSLRRMENGSVLMITDVDPKYREYGGVYNWTGALDSSRIPAQGDPLIMYYQPLTNHIEPPWREAPPTRNVGYDEMHFKDGVLYKGAFYAAPGKSYGAVWNAYATEIREIRLGTVGGESILVYKQGEDIALCTLEEEEEWERQVNIDGEYDAWEMPCYDFLDNELQVPPEP